MKIGIDANILRYALQHVYFINGTAYAGKSTMVHLLAEKYGGIECGENYHDVLSLAIDPEHQPNLCYFDTMSGWQEFISRPPEVYNAWIHGCSEEAVSLELVHLLGLVPQGKPIFVDTNIPVEILREIAPAEHIALMLSPPRMSVDRFFDRPDAEKQFLYQKILEAPDPQWAMENFRACLAKINSEENYRAFADSGCFCYVRREDSTLEEAMTALESHFGLKKE